MCKLEKLTRAVVIACVLASGIAAPGCGNDGTLDVRPPVPAGGSMPTATPIDQAE